MTREQKIERMQRAGWKVRFTNSIEKKRILATRKVWSIADL